MKFFRGLLYIAPLALLSRAILFAVIAAFTCKAGDYKTYAAEPFRRIHFGEMDNVFIDTVHVWSITVRPGVIVARITESDQMIEIRYPDRLERI